MAELKDTFYPGQEVDITFRATVVRGVHDRMVDVELADGQKLCIRPTATGAQVRPTVDDSAAKPVDALASLTTAEGTWGLVELHKRPGGDADAIVSRTAPGRRPVLCGFRRGGDNWQQLAGEWTDITVARTDVARATAVQAASRQALFFLDAAMVGRTS